MKSVNSRAFSAIQKVDTKALSTLSERELRPLLPCLVRMALCPPLDVGEKWLQKRKEILKILAGIEIINSLVGLLSIDFQALDVDIKKEQVLRQKLGGGKPTDSILVQNLENGLAFEFEQSDAPRKLRLVLSEVLASIGQAQSSTSAASSSEPNATGTKFSELFDNEIYFEEVSDVLCIAQAEVSSLLSLPCIAEGLLYFKCGPSLLCRLVANSPDSFTEVYTCMISNGPKEDVDRSVGAAEIRQRRMDALKMLCEMNPSHSLIVRAYAVEYCRMPGLAVALTLEHCKQDRRQAENSNDGDSFVVSDLVSFVSGLLLGSDSQIRQWFSNFIRTSQKRNDSNSQMLQLLRKELLLQLDSVLPSPDSTELPNCRVVQASALLRLYCALKGIAGMKFHDEEVNILLRVITSHPPASPAGVRFVSIGLCLLNACPSLLGNVDQERRAIEWIRWLIKEEAYFESNSGVTASFGEMLLLLAIHFHGNQITAITDLICSTLGMKIAMRANNLTRIKTIFTQDIFTEKVVTAHAVRVPVTSNLSANIQGFLPVHCIHQLLKSRAFSKHQVPIKNWIYKQIRCTVAPLHPVMPALVEVYVTSIIVPSSGGKSTMESTNEPLTDDEILSGFQNSKFSSFNSDQNYASDANKSSQPSSMTSQLLLLYYVMQYEDYRLANMKSIVSSGRKVKCYSEQLISQLPIKYLLQQAQKEQQNYAGLFAPLLKSLTSNYPHLCLPQGWINELEGHPLDVISMKLSTSRCCSPRQLDKAFRNLSSAPAMLMVSLDQLLTIPVNRIWRFADVLISNFPLLLDAEVPRQILNKAQRVWWKLNSVFPRHLWVMTVRVLQIKSSSKKNLCQNDIVLDPLTVLRCDERVFLCPPLLEIILHMLKAFLAASSTHLSQHILNNPITSESIKSSLISGCGVETDKDREELKVALIAAQESAALQILLEACLATEEEQQTKNSETLLSNLREVQCLVCSHLHQVFITDPSLAKLVHFQCYPSKLIPIVVNGVPSMHICLDFIPELLSQPDIEKQIFGIELISHLCLKYALPKSLSIARLSVQVVSTLLTISSTNCKLDIFIPTLPALVRICRAFPPLCEEVIGFLLQLGRVFASQLSLECSSPMSFTEMSSASPVASCFDTTSSNSVLGELIKQTFDEICDKVVLNKIVY